MEAAIKKFNSLPKSAQQAIIGSSSGWITGFTVTRFGRYAGFSVGSSILLIQLGLQYGYINIDWKSVNRDLKKAKEEVEKHAGQHLPGITEYIKNNTITASSFLGGFLLGASC